MMSASATHLFRNSCWVIARISTSRVRASALQNNNALVSVSPSTRGDAHPTTGFNNVERHLWEAVIRNEHHFSCRVFGFDQVNQVTT